MLGRPLKKREWFRTSKVDPARELVLGVGVTWCSIASFGGSGVHGTGIDSFRFARDVDVQFDGVNGNGSIGSRDVRYNQENRRAFG